MRVNGSVTHSATCLCSMACHVLACDMRGSHWSFRLKAIRIHVPLGVQSEFSCQGNLIPKCSAGLAISGPAARAICLPVTLSLYLARREMWEGHCQLWDQSDMSLSVGSDWTEKCPGGRLLNSISCGENSSCALYRLDTVFPSVWNSVLCDVVHVIVQTSGSAMFCMCNAIQNSAWKG